MNKEVEPDFCLQCGNGLDDQGDCVKCHYPYDMCDCEPIKELEEKVDTHQRKFFQEFSN